MVKSDGMIYLDYAATTPLDPRVADAMQPYGRELFGNPNPFTSGFPGQHPILMSLAWTTGLLAVFAPLAVRKYRSIDR